MGIVMESKESKYQRAKKQVEEIKGWYTHVIIYIVINTLLQFFYSGFFDSGRISDHFPWWVRLTTPFFWGLAVIGHGIYVHKGQVFKRFYKNWEDRKIKEMMEEDEAIFQNKSKWE